MDYRSHVLHGRDPQLSGPDGNVYASVCLCGETFRAQTQDTADRHLEEGHIDTNNIRERAA